ncbi:MAG: cell division protein ZipA [Methylococcaceae bacterium]|nr:cell division protein ZipA [Methylococcaceae bacterium]
MDRETVRMILLVAGVLAIVGVYLWGRYQQRMMDFIDRKGEFDELGGFEEEQDAPEESDADPDVEAATGILNPHAYRHEPEPELYPDLRPEQPDDDDDPVPERPKPHHAAVAEPSQPAPLGAPFLIQLSVVADQEGYFNGEELRDALSDLDLIYGDMGIYHRYDREYRKPLFSVASLVEPGTFPIDDMENFDCPGVVLFFQPPQVADPIAVFDDLVNTAHDLAQRLDGVEWDERRQPLTEEKLALMRERLEEAY